MPGAAPAASAVLVVGDANPDLILRGDVVPRFGQAEQLLTGADSVIGGSAAITAHGLARLGRRVGLVAAIGKDAAGELLSEQLARAGVDVQHLASRPTTPTGLTVVLAPDAGSGVERAILTLPGAIPTLTAAEVRTAIAAGGCRHVHVSSLFLQPSLVGELPGVLAEARAAGASTSLDTNDDPAGTWLGVEPLLPHLDLLLPNRREVIALAAALSGPAAPSGPARVDGKAGVDGQAGVDDAGAAAAVLAARGPLVVVKDGAQGAFAVGPGQPATAVPAPRTEVLDTTGAGDTFDAAFLDAWLARRPLDACLSRATLAGSLAVTALGGTAGQPSADDLATLDRSAPER